MSEKETVDVSKLSEFEISILLIERDTAQFKAERIDALINKYGRVKGFVDAEKKGSELSPFVDETTFYILKFEPQKGERLGEFAVADKASNIPDKFSQAYGILRTNNATIQNRYHGPDYEYTYWLYGEGKIYRQKKKRT